MRTGMRKAVLLLAAASAMFLAQSGIAHADITAEGCIKGGGAVSGGSCVGGAHHGHAIIEVP
jgi:hypothetical protein